MKTALDRLGALAQETRLALFRRLVERGPEGLAAGALAEALGVPAPTLSFHVAQLERAGLVEGRREGRSIVYAARFSAMHELLAYLFENCCQGAGCAPAPEKPAPAKRRPKKGAP
jgi:DNA-binding transcriptional ArsR family regulator